MTMVPYPNETDADRCADCGRPRHAHQGQYKQIEDYCYGFAEQPTELGKP